MFYVNIVYLSGFKNNMELNEVRDERQQHIGIYLKTKEYEQEQQQQQ